MRVSDIMTTDVLTVSPNDRIEKAARLIAEHGISGVLVVDKGRLVGKVSHSDLLKRLFPTHSELYEDWAHNHDFEQLEMRASELIECKVVDCMSEDAIAIDGDAPVMKAASGMLLKDVHRVAVTDDDQKLMGIVSRGDIFYHTLQNALETSAMEPEASLSKSTPAEV